MFFPTKINKKILNTHKNKVKKKKKNYNKLNSLYNTLLIKSINKNVIFPMQLSSILFLFLRKLKKMGKIFFNIFANIPVTKKATNARMGKGKGKQKIASPNY
jgi:large subunit ribosomal protein L16